MKQRPPKIIVMPFGFCDHCFINAMLYRYKEELLCNECLHLAPSIEYTENLISKYR
jgi:hypothetical protein